MWIFTTYGYFTLGPAAPLGDEPALAIRARKHAHLAALLDRFPGLKLHGGPIAHHPGDEAPYRLDVPLDLGAGALGTLAREAADPDAPGLIEAVGAVGAGFPYAGALDRVQAVMRDFQNRFPG